MKILSSVLIMMIILLGISCSNDERKGEHELIKSSIENTSEVEGLKSVNENEPIEKNIIPDMNTGDFSILLLISLVLNVIMLICVFGIYRKQVKQQREFRNQTIDIVNNSNRISDYIEQKVSLSMNKSIPSVSNTEKESIIGEFQKLVRLDIREIIDEEFRKKNHLNCISQVNNNKEIELPQCEEYLYASSVDKDSHVFYSVSSQPQDDTIYSLSIDIYNKNKAAFEVFKGAFSKIIEVPDFLEDASEYRILGSEKVLTEDKGIAEKQADGKWKVLSKAKVKFI